MAHAMLRRNKKPGRSRIFNASNGATSGSRLDVRSLLALRALNDLELHLLTFFEGLEAVHLDCREVSEQIFATLIRRDEPETLGVVKPFDRTGCHTNFP